MTMQIYSGALPQTPTARTGHPCRRRRGVKDAALVPVARLFPSLPEHLWLKVYFVIGLARLSCRLSQNPREERRTRPRIRRPESGGG